MMTLAGTNMNDPHYSFSKFVGFRKKEEDENLQFMDLLPQVKILIESNG